MHVATGAPHAPRQYQRPSPEGMLESGSNALQQGRTLACAARRSSERVGPWSHSDRDNQAAGTQAASVPDQTLMDPIQAARLSPSSARRCATLRANDRETSESEEFSLGAQ